MKLALPCGTALALCLLSSHPSFGADHHDPEKLGTIRFEVSGSDAARARVVRGVKLLHHMMYVEADREFGAAVAADPRCALGFWGRAMAIVHPLWPDAPTTTELEQGAKLVRAGLALQSLPPREQVYLEAIQAYYRDAGSRPHSERLKSLDEAWGRVAEAYPQDLDAAAFSALFHLAPARFLPKDKSHRIQLAAAALIERVLAQIPDHPGAQHYKIHAYDFPLLAGRALEICDTYGAIAPDVPHALHMPTHIFTRRGLWEQSIEFNLRSAEAARRLGRDSGTTSLHEPHALDYLAYAYLQRGQYRKAEAVCRDVAAMAGPFHSAGLIGIGFAFAAIPARHAMERHDWAAAAALELRRPGSFPWSDAHLHCDAMGRFTRAIGSARSAKLDQARREVDELLRLHERISRSQPNSYWSAQAETQLLASQAWLMLAEGRRDEALARMRRAFEIESTTDKEAVTPGEVLPAGELLGDMLLELGRPGEALAVFEAVLESSPNRLNSLLGAGQAAEQARETVRARRHYGDAVRLVAEADTDIERLRPARAFLAGAHAERE